MKKDYCDRCGSRVFPEVEYDIHTCNSRAERSSCCNTKVFTAGRHGEGSTRWYQCIKCNQPCDVRPPADNIES